MNIAIIDADIVNKNKHRFPNLACMKISAYYKNSGDNIILKTDYNDLENFDKIFVSKVFTNTIIPCEPKDKTNKSTEKITEWYQGNEFLKRENIEYGGTGFYYDKAPKLPDFIEHIMPDYNLYNDWIKERINNGAKEKEFVYYKDYSIGFVTRGCFRKCEFCVNKNCEICVKHSNVMEFMDSKRKKLCFLDDNFFACKDWREIIAEIKSTGKKFQFKQGLDERLITEEKIHELNSWKYDGDYIFAFDNIEDKSTIEAKLNLIFKLYPNFKKRMKFYIFCGFDRNDLWDKEFWINDIKSVFERCFILAKYSALPYVMRYERSYSSQFKGMYTNLSSWVNQPSLFKKFSFRLFCQCRGMNNENYSIYKRNVDKYLEDVNKKGSSWKYMEEFSNDFPEIANKYFDIIPDSLLEFGNGKKIK